MLPLSLPKRSNNKHTSRHNYELHKSAVKLKRKPKTPITETNVYYGRKSGLMEKPAPPRERGDSNSPFKVSNNIALL